MIGDFYIIFSAQLPRGSGESSIIQQFKTKINKVLRDLV